LYLERLGLAGRTAVVGGAGGGGIGTATALALAEAGARVVAVDIETDRVEETEMRIAEIGGRCVGVTADLRERDQCERVMARAVEAFGGVDHVANVAGGTAEHHWAPLLEQSDRNFEELMRGSLGYVFVLCQLAARDMVRRGRPGSMVNVASVSGLNSAPYHAHYGAAKAGLMSLTRTMAVEWGPHDIRVNALAPGAVKTPRILARGGEELDAMAREQIPLQRACTPEDIAGGILFLLSDLAGSVTGHTLVVDGGAQAKFPFPGVAR